MRIRRAAPKDVETMLQLIKDLALYERSVELAKATSEQLLENFFCDAPSVFCDLVETDEGDVAGFAVWFLNYSTWTGTHGIFLEDLFIKPEFRGRGYGTALLVHLAQECEVKGYKRLKWSVLDWNQPSIDFYRSLGAEALDEWTEYRLYGEALSSLASSGNSNES
ncbi:MAG TPA: GNAT family N-acetyltransferase [Acidimicrobiales bacterium]|nr:GNAT family N-acetyltransferase [Acidimicrobiales bacterium]